MSDVSDVTQFINFKRYTIVLVYHFLRFCVTGPFTWIVVALFSGKQYAENLGFGWKNNAMKRFTIIETIQWSNFVISALILLYEKIVFRKIK